LIGHPLDVLVLHDAAAGAFDPWTMLGGLGLFFGVMYLFVLRPKQQEEKQQETMIAGLAKDDAVVLSSGIHGKIAEIQADILVVEISDKTRIRVDKSAVARKAGAPAPKK
jgi:preprotein translocase subunit YajC